MTLRLGDTPRKSKQSTSAANGGSEHHPEKEPAMTPEIRETPMRDGKIDFPAIHPDPEIAREVVIDTLVGQLAEAHAAMCRALDFRTATPEGLAIKHDVREALTRTGFRGDPGLRSTF